MSSASMFSAVRPAQTLPLEIAGLNGPTVVVASIVVILGILLLVNRLPKR